jgi:hypothetical protein
MKNRQLKICAIHKFEDDKDELYDRAFVKYRYVQNALEQEREKEKNGKKLLVWVCNLSRNVKALLVF